MGTDSKQTDFSQTDFLFGSNAVFIEELYNLYLSDQTAVDENWQKFFQNIKDSNQYQINKTTAQIISPAQEKKIVRFVESSNIADNYKARAMIAAYRKYAHFLVKLDPLNLEIVKTKSQLGLNIEDFGFTKEQLTQLLEIDDKFLGIKSPSLSKLVDLLDQAYGHDIAIEFDHIEDVSEKIWLAERMENRSLNFMVAGQDNKDILKDLVEIEGFEQYLHTKFPGAKRFSIKGGEATIIAMDKAIDMSVICGASEIVIGMAHRGRISTLTKIMKKPYREVIAGFITGSILPDNLGISGDVKYHIGYSSDRVLGEFKIHLSLAYNPSHLEAINPVVAGKVRAKQDNIGDITRKKVIGILVHGDSAFCGQGVVAESLSMAKLKPYDIGGIIHLVINNQLGFTANSCDTRTSRYSTEFTKIINAPILHVNGDDIEALLTATDIAVNYRNKFSKDIIIEIICYRKYGHNEGDEPLYTQPVMYNVIQNKQSPVDIYAASLIKKGLIDEQYFFGLKEQFRSKLDQEYELAKKCQPQAQFLEKLWSGYSRADSTILVTGVNKDLLKQLGIKLCQIPKDFSLNTKLAKLFEIRAKTLQQDQAIDWATAEQLAFASLLVSGTKIRFTGQDVGRGTFSHRHAVLHSQIDDKTYIPLNNLLPHQANLEIADSNLSEYAVLGFEYGYSLVDPKNLVIWEAQFGDFANGAQIIFDQFIASSENKWLRMSGLVVLLPHGFEGQGPDHSSARIERFLQLAAENNIRVTYPTTPASLFHLLRRQIYSNTRIPLIIMSPKSLLRHKMVVSNLSEFDVNTGFIQVIDEINKSINAKNVIRVILCSGKVYYDLLEKREEKNILDIAIIRVEQLYPLENNLIIKILANYNKAGEFIWCQEEPRNMGAWGYIKDKLNQALKAAKISKQIKYVGRSEAASPATGSLHIHNEQQLKLVEEAIFNINLGE